MRPRGQRRVWVLVLVGLLLLTLGAGCASMEEKRDKFMQEGQVLYDKGDYVRARLQFKNALQINPKYAPALMWLAKTELKLENWRGAFGALQQAVEADPKLLEAQVTLGRIYLGGKKLAEAEERLKVAQEINPKDIEVLLLAAGVAAAKEKYQEALELYREIKVLDPKRVEAYLGQAQMEVLRQNPAAAAAVLEEGIKAAPEAIGLYVARGRLAAGQKDFATAETFFRQAIDREPKNISLLNELAQLFLANNKPDEAEAILRQTMALEPDNEKPVIMTARLLMAKRQVKEGEALLKDFIAKHPDNANAKFALAEFYLANQRENQALKTLQEIVGNQPTTPAALQAKNQIALIHARRGRLAEAQQLVDEVIKENPKDMTATRTRGLIALAQKNGLEAVNNFRIYANDQPTNPEAKLLLARAHLINNELEQARDQAKRALELKPDYLEARRFLYGTYLQKKDYDGLIQLLKNYLNYNEKDAFNLVALAEAYAAKGDLGSARSTLQRLLKLEPESPLPLFQMARLEMFQKKPAEAIKYLQEALQKNPNFIEAAQFLTGIYQENNQLPKALETVDKLLARSPQNPLLYQLKGELLLLQKKPEAAAAALEAALTRNPRQLGALRLLVLAYAQNPDLEKVKQELAAKTADPKAPLFYTMAEAMFYERLKDYQRAREVYEQMIKRGVFVGLAKNNLAYLYAEHLATPENLQQALALVNEILDEAPEDPNILDTKGWILCKMGDYRQAQSYLTQAAETAPNNPTLKYHLAFCEAKLGEIDKAKNDLEKMLELKINFPERAAAETLLLELRQQGAGPSAK